MKLRSLKKAYLLILLPLFLSCSEEEELRGAGAVNFRIELNETGRDQVLKTPYEAKIFTSARNAGEYIGKSGLLIFNSGSGIDIPTLVVYDLCCPYENRADIRIKIKTGNTLRAVCEECSSEYDLLTVGKPVAGPSQKNLYYYGQATAAYPYTGYFTIRY